MTGTIDAPGRRPQCDRMTSATPRKRTRLTPEARRDMILDHAAAIVLREGLQAAGMERLARDCGVSKGLVYNYFPTRDAVFAALLEREQADLRDRGMAHALKAENFADLIRQTTRLYLDQILERGALISALLADPSVARLMEATNQQERDRTIRYFERAARREFGLSEGVATAATDALMNLTGGMARQVSEGRLEVGVATEMCVTLITGGLAALARASAD
jgi:AcrR family transcriptional regulator